MKKVVLLFSCFLFNVLYAAPQKGQSPWAFIAAIGFTDTAQMQGSQGLTNFKRLAVHRELFKLDEYTRFSLVIGSQDGNEARPKFSQGEIDALGGGNINAMTKTGFDFLAEILHTLNSDKGYYSFLKIGGMWRQLQFNTPRIQSLTTVSPELQVGLSANITKLVRMGLAYQGIYAPRMKLSLNGDGTGSVNNIPMQNGAIFTIFSTI